MKLHIKILDQKIFEEKLQDVSHINFSLFIDDIPKSQSDLSDINILVLQEPNEYFRLHDYAIQNHHLFDVILTWDYKILNVCPNSIFLPFGSAWIKPEYNKNYEKKFQISHLCGALNKTYGHSLRHELLARENEISILTKFYHTYGDRFNMDTVGQDKIDVFSESMFGVAIENINRHSYFTEKLIDLLLMKTIPIYWGCSNIDEFFDLEGIIKVENVDDIIYICNNTLTESFYKERKEVINLNWHNALKFINYEQRIVNEIIDLFKFNNLYIKI